MTQGNEIRSSFRGHDSSDACDSEHVALRNRIITDCGDGRCRHPDVTRGGRAAKRLGLRADIDHVRLAGRIGVAQTGFRFVLRVSHAGTPCNASSSAADVSCGLTFPSERACASVTAIVAFADAYAPAVSPLAMAASARSRSSTKATIAVTLNAPRAPAVPWASAAAYRSAPRDDDARSNLSAAARALESAAADSRSPGAPRASATRSASPRG